MKSLEARDRVADVVAHQRCGARVTGGGARKAVFVVAPQIGVRHLNKFIATE
jgi:hypothetical protein